MKPIMALMSWITAVGYSAVGALAVIMHSWCLVVLALLAIIITHVTLIQAENTDGQLHRAPKDTYQ
jgi:uncharacterized membrane protein